MSVHPFPGGERRPATVRPSGPVDPGPRAAEDAGERPGRPAAPVTPETPRAGRHSQDDAARLRFALGPPLIPPPQGSGRPEGDPRRPAPRGTASHPRRERRTVVLGPRRGVPPTAIPRVPGVEFAVRYEPAGAHADVGGDFYQVLPVGDRVLVGVGDVVGHSMQAATVMAELLPVLRALVRQGNGPKATLCRLNGMMLRYRPDHTATACLMMLDPLTGALEIANAGHPPPLICADGRARYLRHGGVLLGVAGDEVRVERLVLPPGGAAVLFTDGLIERRGEPIDDGMARLRHLCAAMDGDLEELCDRILGTFGPREDDVALLILRRH